MVFSFVKLVLCILPLVRSDPWSLTGHTGPGPDEWANTYPLCNGSRQTPIDVPENTLYDSSLTDFNFTGYDSLGIDDMTLTHNGYSAMVTIKDASIGLAFFNGGGYIGNYLASRLHFHWGPTDSAGSDHSFQGKHYAAAVHMGHFKEEYGEIFNSINYPDGLTGLVTFFELDDEDNPDIEPYITALENINIGDSVPFGTSFSKFLPKKTDKFYKYEGSMPLPPCKEVVVWTLFKHPNKISSSQLARLRTLHDGPIDETDPHYITGNNRPTQPLNGRIVTRNFDEDDSDSSESSDSNGEN